jgi:NitT/TauT family transport system permease protein
MTQPLPVATSPATAGGAAAGAPTAASGPAARPRSASLEVGQRLLTRTAITVLVLAILVALWQAVVSGFSMSPAVLPSPAQTWDALSQNFSVLMSNAEPTLIAALLGFAVSAVLGIPLGYALARPGPIARALNTGTVALQIFPKVCVAPLFIVWFGFGYFPKVLFVFLLGFFPIALNAAAGFSSVPKDLDDLVSVIGFGPMRRLRRIHGMWALPQIFTGLKISASFVMIAVIAAEWVGSQSGLGVLIMQSQANLNLGLAFAAVFVVAVIGFAIYGVLSLLEMFAIPWHVSRRRLQ